ncbi:hypothetical protein Gpo141_00003065 [Globisporangium polare]
MSDDCMGACCTGCIEGVCIACCATVGTLCCDLVCRPVCGRCCNSCFDRCEDCCGCASSSSSRRRRQRSYSYEEAARYSNEGINGSGTYDPPIVVVPVKVQPPASSSSFSPHGAGGDVTQAYPAPAGYPAPIQTTATSGQYPPSNQEMNRHAG